MNKELGFFEDLFRAKFIILDALKITLVSAFGAIIIGTIIGILIGMILTYGNKYVKFPFRLSVDIIRGIPGLVMVFIIYYFLDFLLQGIGIFLDPVVSGIIALAIPCAAQTAEITRGALQAIPIGQMEAGKAVGMSFIGIFRSILLPQAIVTAIPPWINTATEVVKSSTFLGLVGIGELLLISKQLVARSNLALEYYIFAGVLYFAINTLIEYFGKRLDKRLSFERN